MPEGNARPSGSAASPREGQTFDGSVVLGALGSSRAITPPPAASTENMEVTCAHGNHLTRIVARVPHP
jgi:hypothetical protein